MFECRPHASRGNHAAANTPPEDGERDKKLVQEGPCRLLPREGPPSLTPQLHRPQCAVAELCTRVCITSSRKLRLHPIRRFCGKESRALQEKARDAV